MGSAFSFGQRSRPRPAGWHYERRRERRRRQLGRVGWRLHLEQIGDRDRLFECYQLLEREGGPGPGIDGVSPLDLSPGEAGDLVGALSKALLSGTYRPQEVRLVEIPKPGTNEFRTLKIGTVADRIVGKALHMAWGPLWEQRFLDSSYGFRLGRSTWMLLAKLEAEMRRQDRWVLAIDDVRKAFDNVPIDPVVELHADALSKLEQKGLTKKERKKSLRLVEKVLRGHDDTRSRGIDQGGPYSPSALNVLLHYTLDLPMVAQSGTKPRWSRYADNVAYLAKCVSEGEQSLARASQLLGPLEMSLKGKDGVSDLTNGEQVQLLGFTLQKKGDRISYGIGQGAWDSLEQSLLRAHTETNPPSTARQAVLGWVGSLGPAFENGDCAEVLRLASGYGFRELSPSQIWEGWQESWRRWQRMRMSA